ncbi:hypothetical protein [Desulfallas thermosapovorans]|uniref:Uncharacterized protein n=1 Tax=Desulfallas thermosapovorans DSM 6562 TaxID=1121431 RepID=A0A5S4ZWD1_9FIRM|nr:hypothetical protein [Desulfallas thermosapovorans]TYO97328.1 hypothetical protein LX24_00519 [Desulfallas thermosapovorans DSM 6562]
MAVVINMGDLRAGVPANEENERKNLAERWLEEPFLRAELARVEMCRADHPSQVSEGVINYLFAGAMCLLGCSAFWFVKYVM